jgi:hypothetical protein
MAFAPNAPTARSSPTIAGATPLSARSGARPRRFAAVLLATLAFALVPNEPHEAWYAIPEIVCDWTTTDQDQWRCDGDPVTWRRGFRPHTQNLRYSKSAPE